MEKENQRKEKRVAFACGVDVHIMAIDGTWRRACVMNDVSESGAKLTTSSSIAGLSLKEFFLLLSVTGLAYRRCTLAWADGEILRDSLDGPFQDISNAVDRLNVFRHNPACRIRQNVLQDAIPLILRPVMPTFVDRYPDVEIDLMVSNRMVDVVKGGFDAGIRYGGTVPQDMNAQRLSPDLQWVMAASPEHLNRFGTLQRPPDLANHRCLRLKMGDRIYHWEFDRGDEHIEVDVLGSITVDEATAVMEFISNGVGLLFFARPLVESRLAEDRSKLVLEDWATIGPGYYMYYPS